MYETFGRFLGRCPFTAGATSPPNGNEVATPQPAGTKLVPYLEGYDASNANRGLSAPLLALDAERGRGQHVRMGNRMGDPVWHLSSFVVPALPGADVGEVTLPGWVLVGRVAGIPPFPQMMTGVLDASSRQIFSATGVPIVAAGFDDGAGNAVDDGDPHAIAAHTAQVVTANTQYSATVGALDWETYPGFRGMFFRVRSTVSDGGNYLVTEIYKNEFHLSNNRHRFYVTGAGAMAPGNQVHFGAVYGYIEDFSLLAGVGWIEARIDTAHLAVDENDTFDGIVGNQLVNDDAGTTADVGAYTKPGDPVLLGDLTGFVVDLMPPAGVYFGARALLSADIPRQAGPVSYLFAYLAPEPQLDYPFTYPTDVPEILSYGLRNWAAAALGPYDLSQVLKNIGGGGTTPPTKVSVQSQAAEVDEHQIEVLDTLGAARFYVDEDGDTTQEDLTAAVSPTYTLRDSGGEFNLNRTAAGTQLTDTAAALLFKDVNLAAPVPSSGAGVTGLGNQPALQANVFGALNAAAHVLPFGTGTLYPSLRNAVAAVSGSAVRYIFLQVGESDLGANNVTVPWDGFTVIGMPGKVLKWSANTGLFDLNGKSGCWFENLEVEFTGNSNAPNPQTRFFLRDGGAAASVRGLTVRHVKFYATTHAVNGFIELDGNSGGTSYLNVEVSNCDVRHVADYFVYICGGAGDIRNNWVEASRTTSAAARHQLIGVVGPFKIVDNYLSADSAAGNCTEIVVLGGSGIIRGNAISGSRGAGVLVRGEGCFVEDNTIYNCGFGTVYYPDSLYWELTSVADPTPDIGNTVRNPSGSWSGTLLDVAGAGPYVATILLDDGSAYPVVTDTYGSVGPWNAYTVTVADTELVSAIVVVEDRSGKIDHNQIMGPTTPIGAEKGFVGILVNGSDWLVTNNELSMTRVDLAAKFATGIRVSGGYGWQQVDHNRIDMSDAVHRTTAEAYTTIGVHVRTTDVRVESNDIYADLDLGAGDVVVGDLYGVYFEAFRILPVPAPPLADPLLNMIVRDNLILFTSTATGGTNELTGVFGIYAESETVLEGGCVDENIVNLAYDVTLAPGAVDCPTYGISVYGNDLHVCDNKSWIVPSTKAAAGNSGFGIHLIGDRMIVGRNNVSVASGGKGSIGAGIFISNDVVKGSSQYAVVSENVVVVDDSTATSLYGIYVYGSYGTADANSVKVGTGPATTYGIYLNGASKALGNHVEVGDGHGIYLFADRSIANDNDVEIAPGSLTGIYVKGGVCTVAGNRIKSASGTATEKAIDVEGNTCAVTGNNLEVTHAGGGTHYGIYVNSTLCSAAGNNVAVGNASCIGIFGNGDAASGLSLTGNVVSNAGAGLGISVTLGAGATRATAVGNDTAGAFTWATGGGTLLPAAGAWATLNQ